MHRQYFEMTGFVPESPILSNLQFFRLLVSTALKFSSKFFWKRSFFDQTQQPLNNVEPFERLLWALLMDNARTNSLLFSILEKVLADSDCFFLSFFARDFRRVRFFFSGSACFSKVAPPGNLQSWAKYWGKFESSGKEFRWTKFNAEERVTQTT